MLNKKEDRKTLQGNSWWLRMPKRDVIENRRTLFSFQATLLRWEIVLHNWSGLQIRRVFLLVTDCKLSLSSANYKKVSTLSFLKSLYSDQEIDHAPQAANGSV